jgi:ABC-type transport system involved in cytochrome c biogenesis permease component
MKALRAHLSATLRLHFRNRMALIYGYLFPVIFLIAFWVLYRYERVPLIRHMGELLTVTVLGGACFGLPTSMVSERERGVWRRYRLTPTPTGSLVTSTIGARYVAILSAGVLQLALAMAFGMPMPRHPVELWLVFSLVTFSFIGLGLVIAMLADNVPAVQALGQCIFLPMLIIGGVAVQLESLPDWALHVSAFFPGRYAVQAIQACVTGEGLGAARFSLFALAGIGAAGALAGTKMFRWDAQQRFAQTGGKAWLAVALGAWLGVGWLAEVRGHVGLMPPAPAAAATAPGTATKAPVFRTPVLTPEERTASNAPAAAAKTETPAKAPVATPPQPVPVPNVKAPEPPKQAASPAPVPPAPPAGKSLQATLCPSAPASWQLVTTKNAEDDIGFDRLPPDSGVVTPIASDDLQPDPEVDEKLRAFSQALAAWLPAKAIDPVQRVRNYLYAMAVPDVFQLDMERFLPWYVFDRLVQDVPQDDLPKILYWIACTPDRGADPTMEDMRALGLRGIPGDTEEVRNRAAIYSVKLLGRVLGKIQ